MGAVELHLAVVQDHRDVHRVLIARISAQTGVLPQPRSVRIFGICAWCHAIHGLVDYAANAEPLCASFVAPGCRIALSESVFFFGHRGQAHDQGGETPLMGHLASR